MKIKIISVSIFDPALGEEELNSFLASHQVHWFPGSSLGTHLRSSSFEPE